MNHWFRGHAFKYGLDVKKLKKLEIPFDINCPGCREFVEQEKKNLSLEHLILVLTRHEEGATVGLFVYVLKMLFSLSSLKCFELRCIPNYIFQELKLWFTPGNTYFSMIRQFTTFSKMSKSLNKCIYGSLMFKFTD